MKVISMELGGKEIARIEEGVFIPLIDCRGRFQPNLTDWYEDCFFGVKNSSSFEERFKRVEENDYFCYSKPALKLIAKITKEDPSGKSQS